MWSVHGLATSFGATVAGDLGLLQRELVVIRQLFPWHYPAGSEVEQVLRLERKCVSLLFFNTGYNCLLDVSEFLLFFVSVWLVLVVGLWLTCAEQIS